MSHSGFKHSTARVPRLYKEAARIVQNVKLEGGSFKGLVYNSKHRCLKNLYALVSETLRHGSELDTLLRRTKLLLKEPRLDPWLARVLITEMLWQNRNLPDSAIPLKIVQNYRDQLQSEKAALTTHKLKPGTETPRPRFVRINTLKVSPDAIKWSLSSMGWKEVSLESNLQDERSMYSSFLNKVAVLSENEFMQDLHIPSLLVFPHNMGFYELEEYHNSSLILQDKASCLSAHFLQAPVGSTVLDMCAAPGMKSTHIAATLNNKGHVYAIEMHEGRFQSLRKIVADSGATCIEPIYGDALQFSYKDLPKVEYIIVDPSCSGSGMIGRDELFNDTQDVSKERLQKLAGFQCSLLRRAMTNFPDAKRIVYSTCSIFPDENEAVIDSVLDSTPPNFVPVRSPRGTNWLKEGSSSFKYGSYGLYTQPEVDLTNGFFIAVFERSDNEYVLSEKLRVQDVVTESTVPGNSGNETGLPGKKKKKKKNKAKGIVPSKDAPDDENNEAFERLRRVMESLCPPTQQGEHRDQSGSLEDRVSSFSGLQHEHMCDTSDARNGEAQVELEGKYYKKEIKRERLVPEPADQPRESDPEVRKKKKRKM